MKARAHARPPRSGDDETRGFDGSFWTYTTHTWRACTHARPQQARAGGGPQPDAMCFWTIPCAYLGIQNATYMLGAFN
eukprot:4257909-Pleurochrysis_carterae.AAC.1